MVHAVLPMATGKTVFPSHIPYVDLPTGLTNIAALPRPTAGAAASPDTDLVPAQANPPTAVVAEQMPTSASSRGKNVALEVGSGKILDYAARKGGVGASLMSMNVQRQWEWVLRKWMVSLCPRLGII